MKEKHASNIMCNKEGVREEDVQFIRRKQGTHVLNVGEVCVNKVKEGVGVLTNK